MTNNFKTLAIALTVATTIALPIAAHADREDIANLANTKITLTQAIATAEKHQGGQAVEATLDDDSFKPAYEVSVVKDGRIFEVYVDGVTGEVAGSREDLDD